MLKWHGTENYTKWENISACGTFPAWGRRGSRGSPQCVSWFIWSSWTSWSQQVGTHVMTWSCIMFLFQVSYVNNLVFISPQVDSLTCQELQTHTHLNDEQFTKFLQSLLDSKLLLTDAEVSRSFLLVWPSNFFYFTLLIRKVFAPFTFSCGLLFFPQQSISLFSRNNKESFTALVPLSCTPEVHTYDDGSPYHQKK